VDKAPLSGWNELKTTMTTLEAPKPQSESKPLLAAAPPKPQAISRRITDEQICVLTFDRPNSTANIFDRAVLAELDRHLDFLTSNDQLRGLILTSAKPSIFIAGADIKSFTTSGGPAVRELIELGQSVFNRISLLRIPTVAAIHGACLGGGFEAALACGYRIASNEKVTKIGLPEIQLGILPAWGGSTRLPRLIGLPKALDIILAGKTVAAKQALKYGMVDELAPREYLVDIAIKRIVSGTAAHPQRKGGLRIKLLNSGLASSLIERKARQNVLSKTHGHYPAPLKALDVVTQGLTRGIDGSLALEAEAVEELARTDVCQNLVRIFFLQERAKKIAGSKELADAKVPAVRKIAVIGAGVMGAGIAQWSSARGIGVVLRDINSEQVARGMASIGKLYHDGLKRRAFTPVEARAGLDRIYPVAGEFPLGGLDIVIEAAVERMDLKKEIFRKLDAVAGPKTILATNTSALSVSELAEATTHPERVVGIHFFNPVHKMQLVEVVVVRRTDPAVTHRAVRFVQQLGKLPVIVQDSPGFLVNRILMPYLIEAGHLFETGARIEDVDESMLDFGMPMGPLRLIDEVGVDVSQHVADTLAARYADRMTTPRVLARLLEAKLLDRKGDRGFYLHGAKGKEPVVNMETDKFQESKDSANLHRDALRDRMVFLMVNEAARCLEERVVATPEDVDFGMIMGTGFAPFRGGPLRYADRTGIEKIVSEMNDLVARGETRFAPCELLKQMAREKTTFYPKESL